MSTPEVEPLKWYTRGLKIPKFIGKLATGELIKGGPYPQSQVIAFAVTVVLGGWTMRFWAPLAFTGSFAFFGNWAIVLVAAVVISIVVRHLPQTAVSPVLMATGGLRTATRPSRQVHAGRPLSIPRQHRVRVRATITDLDLTDWSRTSRADDVSLTRETPEVEPDLTITPAPPKQTPGPRPLRGTRVEDKLAALVAAGKG